MRVALLSGGTGGAKLARGLLDVVGPESLTVIANTGDDAWARGVHVSPDPDLVTYWLADAIDGRGYGIRGDTWAVMDALEAAGRPTWFRLGDRDLAMCLMRTEALRAGERLTAAHARVTAAMGVGARVLPMSDDPAPTRVAVRGRELAFQEFMIVERAEGPLDGVGLAGADPVPGGGGGPIGAGPGDAGRAARADWEGAPAPSRDVLAGLEAAEAIVIGPSNPIASIGPILALPGVREALSAAHAPVVAVSPFVGGAVLKGPTRLFCEHAGIEPSAAGLLDAYAGLLDGLVTDEPPARDDCHGVALLGADTLLDTPAARRDVAASILEFAGSLSRR